MIGKQASLPLDPPRPPTVELWVRYTGHRAVLSPGWRLYTGAPVPALAAPQLLASLQGAGHQAKIFEQPPGQAPRAGDRDSQR